jgi:hypothetical protein
MAKSGNLPHFAIARADIRAETPVFAGLTL